MLTIAPPPLASIRGITACMPSQTPFRSVSTTWCHPASSRSTTLSGPSVFVTPAMLPSAWTPPKPATASSTSRFQSPGLRTSMTTWVALPPASMISRAVESSSCRSPITTAAPSEANRRATPRPIPWTPPVMTATLPSNLFMIAPVSGLKPSGLAEGDVRQALPAGHVLPGRELGRDVACEEFQRPVPLVGGHPVACVDQECAEAPGGFFQLLDLAHAVLGAANDPGDLLGHPLEGEVGVVHPFALLHQRAQAEAEQVLVRTPHPLADL